MCIQPKLANDVFQAMLDSNHSAQEGRKKLAPQPSCSRTSISQVSVDAISHLNESIASRLPHNKGCYQQGRNRCYSTACRKLIHAILHMRQLSGVYHQPSGSRMFTALRKSGKI